MRILHSINTLHPSYGGPVQGVRGLSTELTRLGHNVVVVTLDAPDAAWLAGWPVEVVALGPAFSYYRFQPRLVSWLRENAGRFDVVIANGTWRFSSLAVWLALRGSLVPYFVYSHGMLDPFFRRFRWKELKKILFWRALEHRVFRDARAVLFTCDQERLQARNRFRPYQLKEAIVRYGAAGQPLQQEPASVSRPAAAPEPYWLFLGRFHPQKGCDVLLRAFQRVAATRPKLGLVMAGPDECGLQRRLQGLAAGLGVADRVHWPGPVAGAAKWDLLQRAEAFVLSSHHENFCIAMAEALSCGTPVIITRKVGVWREVEEMGAGLVGDDTVEDFAAVLERFLCLSGSQRAAMRLAARRCFLERFDASQAARSLLDTLQHFGVNTA